MTTKLGDSSHSSSSASSASTASSPTSDSIFDDDEEVDQLLEQSFEQSHPPSHIEKTKTVLRKKGQDYFEVLPEGWIEVTHSSGIPLYLHKQSRVCTVSKPYYLGSGSVRKHQLPVSSIPCLQYRKELQKEAEQKVKQEKLKQEEEEQQKLQSIDSNGVETKPKLEPIIQQSNDQHPVSTDQQKPILDNVGLETVQDHKREKWLNAEDVKEYCEKLFEFAEIKIRKFKTWADRRRHNSIIREQKQRPSLPNDTKLITCSSSTAGNSLMKKEFVMNPAGKSFVCILHEFVQHKEKVQPRYLYRELENALTPYSATVEINSVPYGIGYGKSKKDAKEEAARKTIEILIPAIKDITKKDAPAGGVGNGSAIGASNSSHDSTSQDLKFFDNIKIEDTRIPELCTKAGLHSPYQILVECLKRNTGSCEIKPVHNVQLIKHHRNIYTLKVKEHEAKVECKNKREGKQRAAQAILQKLHPQVTSWGGLLLMYGRGSYKTPKEKKEEEQKITELQSTASPNTPNYAILNKLREEMLKLNY